MALIEGYTPAWEYEETNFGGTRGWFPMYDWIGEKLETLFNNGPPPDENIIRFTDELGVVWKFDLKTMTQRRIRDNRDECTRSIRRIMKPS